MATTYVGMAITKFTKNDDGSLNVWGPCTTDEVDSDEQIVDPEFAAKGLTDWLATGANVRVMHNPALYPAGTGTELVRDGNAHYLKTRVVEPNAIGLVENKVLRAYSVGINNATIVRDAKARGGRIVDGEFVEVSLVDRPANASCKVDIVKSVGGQSTYTDIVLGKAADDKDCDTCDGTGKIRDGHMDCPDCHGSGKMADSPDVEKGELDTAARNKLPDSAFAYIDSDGERHLPIHDAGHVKSALGRFNQTQFETDAAKKKAAQKIMSRAKELGIDVDPSSVVAEAAKVQKKGKVPPVDQKVTEALDQVDDDLDDAIDAQEEDNEEHEDGMSEDDEEDDSDDDMDDDEEDDDADKSAIPYTTKRLHDMLCAAYTEKSVLAEYPTIDCLADALDVSTFAKSVSAAVAADGGTGKAAKEIVEAGALYGMIVQLGSLDPDLARDARADLHKDFSQMYPSVHLTPGSITPGMFERPYLSNGRANMVAGPGQTPRLPMDPSVPSADQFDRGPLTDGQERISPSAGPPNSATKAGRTYYTNSARDSARDTMQTVHDLLCSQHPGICPMKDAGNVDAEDEGNVVDNHDDETPSRHDGDLGKAQVADLLKGQKKLTKALRKMNEELEKAQARISELEAQPDDRIVLRGAGAQVAKAADGDRGFPGGDKVKAQTVAFLQKDLSSSDPSTQRHALEQLEELLPDPDEFAAAVVNTPHGGS